MIELAIVLLILAIAAAAVVLRVQGPMQRAEMRRIVDAVEQFDGTTRLAARRQDRSLRLVIDLSRGRLTRTQPDGGIVNATPLEMPSGVSIGKVIVRDRQIRSGTVSIACSRQGWTPSYAMRLDGDDGRRWILFAGMTGAVVNVDDEKQVRDILAMAVDEPAARADAG